MLQSLKSNAKNDPNALFADDEEFLDPDDVDNMDFPLPTEPTTPPQRSGPRIDPSEYKSWVCIYPCFIDSEKSIADGRRIAKNRAFPKPNGFHMTHCVQRLGFSVVYEGHKTHPKDWSNPGRVRVQMKDPTGLYIHRTIMTRKQLMYRIADLMPEITASVPLRKELLITPLTTSAELEALTESFRQQQVGTTAGTTSLPLSSTVTSTAGGSAAASAATTGGAEGGSKKKGKKGKK